MSKRNAEEIIQAVEHYIRVESKQISWAPHPAGHYASESRTP